MSILTFIIILVIIYEVKRFVDKKTDEKKGGDDK